MFPWKLNWSLQMAALGGGTGPPLRGLGVSQPALLSCCSSPESIPVTADIAPVPPPGRTPDRTGWRRQRRAASSRRPPTRPLEETLTMELLVLLSKKLSMSDRSNLATQTKFRFSRGSRCSASPRRGSQEGRDHPVPTRESRWSQCRHDATLANRCLFRFYPSLA